MVLLPEGSEVTLSELREMAARQQQQIEAQQQLLVAKEQRLKFLKQQEARHHQNGGGEVGGERLHHLREKVERQESKLRRLRALRGQTEQQRTSNTNLTAELESIRAIFNEKEKELSLAVAKVDELTRQLEQLRQGNNGIPSKTSPASVELDKLRRELVYRTKLNEQQNARIIQQRENLSKRQEEISATDQRIAELQQRLHRKRIINQQLASQIHAATLAKQAQLRQNKGGQRLRPLSNIAAVEPLKRIPQEPDRTIHDDLHSKVKDFGEFAPNKNDPKYQTLPYNTRFVIKPSANDVDDATEKKPAEKQTPETTPNAVRTSPTGGIVPPSKIASPQHNLTNFAPRPFGTTYSSSLLGPMGIGRLPVAVGTTNGPQNVAQVVSSNSPTSTPAVTGNTVTSSVPSNKYNSSMASGIPIQRSKLPSSNGPLPPTAMTTTAKNGNSTATAQPSSQKSDQQMTSHTSHPPPKNIQTEHSTDNTNSSHRNGSSDSSEHCQDVPTTTDAADRSKPALPPKPTMPSKPVPPPRQTHIVGIAATNGSKRPDLDSALMVLKGNNSTAKSSNGYRYVVKPSQTFASRLGPAAMDQYTKAINHLYRHEMPRDTPETDSSPEPLSETTEPDGTRKLSGHLPIRPRPLTIKKPSGLDPPRLKSSVSNGVVSPTRPRPLDQGGSGIPVPMTMNLPPTSRRIEMPPLFHFPDSAEFCPSEQRVDDTDQTKDASTTKATKNQPLVLDIQKAQPNINPQSELDTSNGNSPVVDSENNVELSSVPDNDSESSLENGKKFIFTDTLSETSHEDCEDPDVVEQNHINNHSAVYRRVKKGNLKTKASGKIPRRVSFDPLALLLDASLEGELELVKKTAKEVSNPSAANDEGITALHNAICAGHFEIVTFLVEFGCDVNAQDSDGWTPLHCAASCNNLPMVKFLVEHGACIFSTTLSDHETAAQKCEEEEEGFDGCSEYLYSVQEKLGILNGGAVYAVYDYEAQNPDELSFKDGDMVVVLRKGDELEREWWWSKLRDREGYVPRNLLGLHSRVAVKDD